MIYVILGFFIGLTAGPIFSPVWTILSPPIIVALDILWMARISNIKPRSDEEDQHITRTALFIIGLIGFYPGILISIIYQQLIH